MPVDDVRWWNVLGYVQACEPDFAARTRGATPNELERLFAGCRRPMPEIVTNLISRMGHGSDVFWPFNRRYEIDIDAMLEDDEGQWIADRFFRVAITNKDEGIDYADLYVDLDTSIPRDFVDPKLIEVPIPWDGRVSHARSHTLMSKMTASAFSTFEIARSGVHGYLGQGIDVPNIGHYVTAFQALTSRMALKQVFAPRAEIQCFRGPAMCLMFDGMGAGMPAGVRPGASLPSRAYVKVWIGATDLDHLRQLGEQIRDHMPPLTSFTRWLPSGPVALKS